MLYNVYKMYCNFVNVLLLKFFNALTNTFLTNDNHARVGLPEYRRLPKTRYLQDGRSGITVST